MTIAFMLFLLLLALVFVVFGALGGLGAIRLSIDSARWQRAVATVIHSYGGRSADDDRRVMVTFITADERTIRTDLLPGWLGIPQVGQQMAVRYDPDDPHFVAQDNAFGRGADDLVRSLIALVIGVFVLIPVAKYFLGLLF